MDKNAGKKKQRVSTDLCAIAGVCFIIRLYNTSESEKSAGSGVYGCTSGRDTENAKKPDRKQIGGEIYTHIQR